MKALHVFNPETDIALASNLRDYTPPKKILKLKETLAFLPSLWAKEGDALLLPFYKEIDLVPFSWIAKEKKLVFLTINDLKKIEIDICPWGWDNNLRWMLVKAGIGLDRLPTIEDLEKIRQLSHRRITIKFHKLWNDITESNNIAIPSECRSIQEANEIISRYDEVYLKAPWSSSGRGIYRFFTNKISNAEAWIKSCINRQGSVMIEKGEKRELDFASEWEYHNGKALFKGWSIFIADYKGSYSGNLLRSQKVLEEYISRAVRNNISYIIDCQRIILEKILTYDYNGPLGIDMFVTADGRLNPCVEINLRRTMGMACINYYEYTKTTGFFPYIETKFAPYKT